MKNCSLFVKLSFCLLYHFIEIPPFVLKVVFMMADVWLSYW